MHLCEPQQELHDRMLRRFQELGLKVAFTDVNAVAQPAEPEPSYFAVRDALVAGRP